MNRFYKNEGDFSTRIPVQPLPYENKALATERELIVNYDDGSMYIVSDNGELIDITAKLSEQIKNANASNSDITIEGLGTIKLARLLQLLWENRIQFTTKEGISACIPKGINADFKSVEVKDNTLQIANYEDASDNTIPVKVNGKLYWRKAASADSTDLSAIQADGDSIILKDGVFTLAGFNDAADSQVPVKINGKLSFININDNGSFGMTEEERQKLEENTTAISSINRNIKNISITIEELKSLCEDDNTNVENMMALYTSLSAEIDEMDSLIDTMQEKLSHIDYEKIDKSISDINKNLNDYHSDIIKNKNNINDLKSSMNSLINSLNENIKRLDTHISDKNIHTSVHFINEDDNERTKGHLYIRRHNEVINDIEETYNAHLRNIYSNLGAKIKFNYMESSDYVLNSDLQIQE